MEDFKLTRVIDFEDTPFQALLEEGKDWQIILGDQIVSQTKFKTQEKVKKYIDTKPWELIIIAVATFIEILDKEKKEKETLKIK